MFRPIAAVFLSACAAWAQTAFEAASIKPSAPPPPDGGGFRIGTKGGPGTATPGIFTAENFLLSGLVTLAYDVKRFQVTVPGWMDTERFDIRANVPEGATKEQFRAMLQNLLTERFKLTVHRENKEMMVYGLVTGKSGPRFKESGDAPANTPAPNGPAANGPKLDADGFPILPPGVSQIVVRGKARRQTTNETMDKFVTFLANQVERPVTDATGLKGKYDIAIAWSTGTPSPGDEQVISIFAAVQDQLGLKLEPKKGMVEMLVVDHAEKSPSAN